MNIRRSVSVEPIVLAAFIFAFAFAGWFFLRPAYALPQTYHSEMYGFSLRLPADYGSTETPNTNPAQKDGVTDIIEFANSNGGFRLTIIVATNVPSALTPQSLLSNYPSLANIATQPLPIAPGVTGLALDNNPARPDQVSDAWFAKGGYLYHFSAYGDGYKQLLPVARTIAFH